MASILVLREGKGERLCCSVRKYLGKESLSVFLLPAAVGPRNRQRRQGPLPGQGIDNSFPANPHILNCSEHCSATSFEHRSPQLRGASTREALPIHTTKNFQFPRSSYLCLRHYTQHSQLLKRIILKFNSSSIAFLTMCIS